jgi:hypothetical protein
LRERYREEMRLAIRHCRSAERPASGLHLVPGRATGDKRADEEEAAGAQFPQPVGHQEVRGRLIALVGEDDLLAITNFGAKSLDEVREKLDERGLSLRVKE